MKRLAGSRDGMAMAGPVTLDDTTPVTSRRHARRDLVILAIPHVILLGGMGLMLVLHPNAVRSGVMSTRAIVVNAALLGTWLLLSFVVLPRLVRNVYVRSAVLTAGAVIAVVLLVVPTLHDTKVVEVFPEVAINEPAADAPVAGAPVAGAPVAGAPATADTTPPSEPVQVSTGEVVGIDHDATGHASVYRRADGSLIVALEDIDIEPGPDYRVYVVPTPNAEGPGDGTELDGLRGNQGTQYYEVPASVGDVGAGWTILVWCRAFGVPVAAATQHAA